MARFPARTTLIAALVYVAILCTPATAADWQLVWSDEFDGTSLDPSKWTPQIGNGCPSLCGWGNNELQFYRAENATVADGMLTIEAREESFGGMSYTSARLRTLGNADWLYGRFEMRAKLPTGKGLWPAFWMLPTDSVYGTWAASGEIDIMEIIGSRPAEVHGTIHFGGTWPENTSSGHTTTLATGDFGDDFHVFALEWEPTELRWYLDGKLYATQTDWYSTGNPFPAPFDERFHLLLNVAVGGYFPGNPDATTVFPQQMVVDYVRVYENVDACEIVYDSMDHGEPHENGWISFGGSVGGGGIGANFADTAPGVGSIASLDAGFGSGGAPGFVGGFGRGRAMDLTGFTHFEMWIKPDPDAVYQLEINLGDDDNGDGETTSGPDDEFQYVLQVGGPGSEVVAGGGWQKVVIPLADFEDDNSFITGGNGILDTAIDGNGMMTGIIIAIIHQSGDQTTFRTDRWAFTSRTGTIAGRVWSDANGNGVVDAGEGGYEGVTLYLIDGASGIVGSTVTTADGDYSFGELPPGSFTVAVNGSTLPAGVTPTFDPDGIETEYSWIAGVSCNSALTDGNFGFAQSTSGPPSTAFRGDHLHDPQPNPFNARTVIRYELAEAGPVRIMIHDTRGRLVRTLYSGFESAGGHELTWDGRDSAGASVASGVYSATLETRSGRQTRRMALIK